MSSLRERRRTRTAQTIRNTAVDLAYELGLDNVTIEMISEAAGVSTRTFFNYFAYKEAAFLPPTPSLSDADIEEFIRGKSGLLDDIVALFIVMVTELISDREHFIKNHEISLKNPKLLALKMSVFDGFEVEISDLLTKRLGDKAETVDVRHVAALIMASVRVGLEAWVANGTSLTECVAKRILALKHIFKNL